nr:hypothetical protein CFP56_56378 [Quercus suber]
MLRGSSVVGESSEESAGKDPDVAVTAGEAAAGVLSQGYAISLSVHGAHHSKEPPESRAESSGGATKGMSLEEFLRSEIPAEGQPLLAAIIRKHPHFLAGCKLGVSLRKSGLQLLVAVLLDMQRTKLDSSNLQRAATEACLTRDDEFLREIADLEREIAVKRAELSLLMSQRDALMQSSSAGGASPSAETFGDGLFD